MLGLDLAERLIADAAYLEKRLSDKIVTDEADARIPVVEAELETERTTLLRKRTELASLENQLGRASEKLSKVEAKFSAAGGVHWEQRESTKARLKAISNKPTN